MSNYNSIDNIATYLKHHIIFQTKGLEFIINKHEIQISDVALQFPFIREWKIHIENNRLSFNLIHKVIFNCYNGSNIWNRLIYIFHHNKKGRFMLFQLPQTIEGISWIEAIGTLEHHLEIKPKYRIGEMLINWDRYLFFTITSRVLRIKWNEPINIDSYELKF